MNAKSRMLGLASTLALVVSLAVPLTAQASGVVWTTKQVLWTGSADTLLITDEADSNRTVVINTSDWAWEVLLPQGASATQSVGAIITVTGLRVNAAAESLYAIPEKCWRGVCARSVLAAGTWTTANLSALAPFGMTGPTWGTWSAGSTATIPYTINSVPVVLYQGRLVIDLDQASSANESNFGIPEFRLNVIGDIGGTTPQLNAARVYITYPKREGSR
jgi:hypothetical protein